ncbi:MAG: hypothetical protein NV67_03355 [Gammaproteobacteria bacterium (ex Lamellibrachia satsuma)]|nr:MAG: hypothetical protein HPY30_15150 [Gammaproteobacteria bacterium (ex Lamellibrachia satsuma)]RRS35453.1 MAG: hypothetical protein NV67_10255 [Gammaproteobacteria bacterium (ex Lamellibrachia satsuma)]RRS37053.1 MAG: hypothetical protein NV67_03355 [Gammaproteobacteria bacterium (ex Lamellibrachia satsuma)]
MVINKLRSVIGQVAKPSNGSSMTSQAEKKRFKRCVLHIGTEKTGTTTIQRFLAVNRTALARDGVIYPSATGKNGGTQWGFVACAQNKPWETDGGVALGIHSASDQELYREALRDNLLREFAAAPEANVLVISSEHLHSRLFGKETIARLKAFLEPWVERFEIVLYLRRQDRVAVSLYSTKIKSGNPTPILFPGAPKGPVPYYFDYDKIYDNWCAVFGEETLMVRLFSPREWEQGDLVHDFCAVCGLHPEGKRMPVVENESLNQMGADFLLEVNRKMPRMVEGQRNKERDAVTRLISELCHGKNYPASRKEAMKFYHRYLECNARIKEKAFPDRSESLFDEDFSDYPESVEQLEPRYEDAVELALRIWKMKI